MTDYIDPPIHPDLFFGITSAVGTPLDFTETVLKTALKKRDYSCSPIKLSALSKAFRLTPAEVTTGTPEFDRVRGLMRHGNEARSASGENGILASLAVASACADRQERASATRCAVLFRQLKHPEEAYLFRRVYDEGFHLIGVHCPQDRRLEQLMVQKGMTEDEAKELVRTDEFEEAANGQRVRETFHLSDVFIRATGEGRDSTEVQKQLNRFTDLLFGDGIHTPTVDEYGMFLAYAAGLRSSQLARQVGAAILTPQGDVLSVGCNEVPKARGGQYWEGDSPDGRDHAEWQGDSSDFMKRDVIAEILDEMQPGWRGPDNSEEEKRLTDWQTKLKNHRISNLTEFGRAVHAEMDAITSAARVGVSIAGATLYTTTFPCHNCTKHIVAAGISRVVYIEPYPKSMAYDLHSDAIVIDASFDDSCRQNDDRRVRFEAFVGVAPRRYADLFSMVTKDGKTIRRKDKSGKADPTAAGLRLRPQEHSYLVLEANEAERVNTMTLKNGGSANAEGSSE